MSFSSFSDHFSAAASSYAHYRPHYPETLFAWLAERVAERRRAWDCGTGNGQAATGLAAHFTEVIATDPSLAQLAHAERSAGVYYAAMTAERGALADRSVDLVTVAQALHWFDRPLFFGEVARVLKRGGILAVWSYGMMSLGRELDREIGTFYHETVGPYWPSERSLVDTGYATIELPFPEEAAPRWEMQAEWTLAQLSGYVSTWSAVSRYRVARGDDPVPALVQRLSSRWGPAGSRRAVRWPLLLRIGRKPAGDAA